MLRRLHEGVAPEAVLRVGMGGFPRTHLARTVASQTVVLCLRGRVVGIVRHARGLGPKEIDEDEDGGDQNEKGDEDDADHGRSITFRARARGAAGRSGRRGARTFPDAILRARLAPFMRRILLAVTSLPVVLLALAPVSSRVAALSHAASSSPPASRIPTEISSARRVPAAFSPAGTVSAEPSPSGTDSAVLSNGLRVLLLPVRSNPMVACTVAVLSGVRDETPATNGAAHFLEHLLFNGTRRRTQEQIAKEAEFLGAYNNASTRDEYTLFQVLVHRDRLKEAMDLQSDMLFHSTLPESVFEKERKIVLEEMAREESQPATGADQFFRSRYYGSDPRGMPVLGTAKSIGAITREAVLDHYRRNYRPERMVLLLAGDFDRAEGLRLLESMYGAAASETAAIPEDGSEDGDGDTDRTKGAKAGRKARPRRGEKADTPAAHGARDTRDSPDARDSPDTPDAPLSSRGPDRREPRRAPFSPGTSGLYVQSIDAGRGYLRIGLPAPGVGDPDAPVVRTIAGLLGSGVGSRLMSALSADQQSLALEASAGFARGAGSGRLDINVTLPPESDGKEAVRAALTALRRLTLEPVTGEELRSVITEEKSSTRFLRDQVHYLGMSVAPDLVLGPAPSLGDGGATLDIITPALVQNVAQRWFGRAGDHGTDKGAASVPAVVATLSSPAVPEGTDSARAQALPQPSPVAAPGPGESAEPARATGAEGRPRPPRRVDLENGLTLVVAENPGSAIFAAHLLVRDRAVMEPPEREGIADVLHRLLLQGSLYLDSEGLAQKMRSIGARIKTVDDPEIPYDDYYTSPRYSYVRYETLSESWREGLGLLFTTIAYPRIETRDVALVVSEEIDLARRAQETPAAMARALYWKNVLKEGPLTHPIVGTPVSLTQIKPEDLRAFHARYFSPDQLILTIVSDVSASEVIESVRATFGLLPRPSGAAPLPPLKPGEPRRRTSASSDIPETTAASREEVRANREQSQIYMGGIFARDAADLAPLIVATTVLSSRITQDLRETRGLAYSVGCTLEDFGAKAWFTASMGTRAENIEEAEAAIRDAIVKYPDSEIDEKEIQRAVNAMRGQVAMRRMTRISQAFSLGFNEFMGRDVGFDAQLDAAFAAVTAADVKRVARRYLDPAKMVTAIAR